MKRTRIILADDHRLFVDALEKFLEPEFEVVGTFNDGYTLLEEAPRLNPDLIVLDVAMPRLNGLSAGRRLKALLPNTKLVYLTLKMDRDIAAEAFSLGASGYLVKSSAGVELIHAIRLATLGRLYVTSLMTDENIGSFIRTIQRKRGPDKLTRRQREVLQLLIEGRSMKETAHVLNVSKRTVAYHKYKMMDDLKIKTSAELIQFAVKESVLSA